MLSNDGFMDFDTLDWVLSMKNTAEDSTYAEFNDLMIQQFDAKASTGGISYAGRLALNSPLFIVGDPD